MADQHRGWDEMLPDTLGMIFRKLPLKETLTIVPSVCKSWRKVVIGPYCWQDIDMEEWSQCKPQHVENILRLLITRSSGSLRRLCVSGLSNEPIISFIASHAQSLRSLELPRTYISNTIMEQIAVKLCNITFLDLSYCGMMGARALEAFGKSCKSLQGLRRVMHPLEVAGKVSQDDEALAIACTMPKLKHLEMAYLVITTAGILEILSRCKNLEYLDIRGCWGVELDNEVLKERFPPLTILGPHVVDCYERNYSEDSSNFSDTSSYLNWEEITDDDFEFTSDDDRVLEVRYYGVGFAEDAYGFDWPPSP